MDENWRVERRIMGRRERGEGILKTISAFYEAKERAREQETTRRRIHTGFMECNRSG